MAEQALVSRPAAHPVTEPEPEPRRQGPPRAGPGQALGPGTGMGNAAQARLMAEQPLAANAVSGVARDLGLGNAAIERAIAAPASELPRRAGDLATPPSTTQHPLAPDFQRLVPAPDRQPARDFQRPGAGLDRRRQAPPSSNAAAGVPAPSRAAAPGQDVADPQQAKQILENATPALDPGMRDAALSAITDPVVAATPAAAVGASSSAAIAAQPDAGATTSGTGAEGGVTLSATDTRGNAVKATPEGEAAGGAAGGEGAGPDQPAAAAVAAGGTPGEGGPGQAAAVELSGDTMPSAGPDTGAGELGTADLVLIDVELAEHQRWAGALGRVGEVASLHRAEFVAEAVGSGFISGTASGLAMGLGMGVVTRFVPAIGPVIGGAMALHGLATRDWAETGATIGRFGEGNDTYEKLANSIASVAAVIDVVSQVLTVISGIAGAVQVAAAVIAGGAVVAAFFTFGATLGIAAVAADVVAVCEEISLAIGEVTTVLDKVNAVILQPCVTLFRALHAFTTQADPREVEAQGQSISAAAAASGSALGAWAGGKAAHAGAPQRPPGDDLPPSQRPAHETPPPAVGEGPTVHFQEPVTPATPVEGGPLPGPLAEPVVATAAPASKPSATAPEAGSSPPVAPAETTTPSPVASPEVVTSPSASTAQAAGVTQAPPAGTPHDPTSFADLSDVVSDLSGSPFGDRLASQAMAPMQDVPRDYLQSPQAALRAAYADIRNDRPAGWDPAAGLQDQHWTKVRDATINAAPGTPPATVEAINANRSPLQSRIAGESSLLLTTEGVPNAALPTGARGTRFFIAEPGEGPMGRPAVAAEPGVAPLPAEPGAVGGPARDPNYRTEHRFADAYLIPELRQQIQASRARAGLPPLDDVQLAVAAGEQARYVMEGTPRTDLTQAPARPWSGEVIERPRDPMQMLLAPEVLSPDLHAKGRTVTAPPHPQSTVAPVEVTPPNPNQTSFDFTVPVAHAPMEAPSASGTGAPPEPVLSTTVRPPTPRPTPTPTPETTTTPRGSGPVISSTFSAAAGAARTAMRQQTPGGPQPGPGSPTFGTRAHQVGALFLPQFFGGGGEAPTYAQRQAAHRARFTGDNQPAEGVERVNPDYPPPPATPAQITAIQNEIMNLLAVRAAAEQEAQHQADRASQCEENQGPIQQTIADTTAGISAVQAHEAAVARREAANQEQQQRQQESEGLVAGYPSRAEGLAALAAPLAAWEGFTSLASHLPGEAGDSMLRMNQEARKMQEAFEQMGAQMFGVDSAGPANKQGLQDDQARLQGTGGLAQTSDEQLHSASTGAAGLQQANEAALAEANDRRKTATERAQESSDAAAEREEKANSLAEQLRAWGRLHAQARRRAIAATTQRLQKEGRIVVESSEQ